MRRLAWLTALALVASCGGDSPKEVEHPVVHHKKKKKKKKPVEVAEAKDDAGADSESKEDKRKKQDEEDAREAEERRERQRKREQEDSSKEADEQAVSSDQGGDSSESSDDDSDKKSDDDESDAKKRKKEEAAEKKKEAAEEKKRKREEAAEKQKEAAEEKQRKKEEAAEEAKAKKAAAADEAKAKKDKKKHSEDADEASSDEDSAAKSDDESSDDDEPKKADKKAKKGKGKAKKSVATKDAKAGKKKKGKKDDDETKDDEAKADEDKADKSDKADKADKEVAKAEEPEEDDSKSSLPPPDPENESKELDLEGGAAPKRDSLDEAPKVTAILAIDRRPLTEPKGKLDLHGGLRVAAITTTGPGAGGKMISNTATSEGFGLGATYGVSDSIQVGIDYTVGLHPGSIKGPLSLSAAFRVKESEKLDIALSAGFALDYLTTTDVTKVPPVTTTESVKGLQFGIWARYHLGPNYSVFTGLPSTPGSAAGLPSGAGLPPLPYHFSIGLGSKAAIAAEVPIGFAFQASPKLYTFAMTSLAHLGMNNSTSAFIFADYIPFSVGGFYANDTKLDFGAVLSDDVKQGLGFLRFDVVARYYLK